MTRWLSLLTVIAVVLALALPVGKASAAFTNRVVRSGDQVTLNGHPYRMLGFNVWRAAINTWNAPPNDGNNLVNAGTTLDDSLSAIKAGAPHANVIRVWAFQQFALNSGSWDWSAIDKVLRVASAHGMRVIMTLEDGWGYERSNSSLPALDYNWYNGGYKAKVLPREKVTYRAWVQKIVTRYAGDPRVVAWELVNEPQLSVNGNCPSASAGTAALVSFQTDIGGLIHSIDPGAIVSPGTNSVNCGASYQAQMNGPGTDLASYHDYSGPGTLSSGLHTAAQQAESAGKPIFVGEAGIQHTVGLHTRADDFKAKMSDAFSIRNAAGYVPWQWDSSPGSGYDDGFAFKAGDPFLPVLDSFHL